MKILDRAALTAAQDLPHVDVAVPEWGEDVGVRIRALTAAERSVWESAAVEVTFDEVDGKVIQKRRPKPGFNVRTTLLGLCLVDENGARLYQNDELDALGSKNGVVLDRLFGVAVKHNGIGEDAVAAAEKNSERNPEDSSSSGSRAN